MKGRMCSLARLIFWWEIRCTKTEVAEKGYVMAYLYLDFDSEVPDVSSPDVDILELEVDDLDSIEDGFDFC